MNKLIIIGIMLTAASMVGRSQDSPIVSIPRDTNIESDHSPAVRQQTFKRVWETVRDKFFDPAFNGTDWDKVREQYGPAVSAARTDAEMYQALNKMLGELHVSHMEVVPPGVIAQASAPPTTTGLGLRKIEGQLVVFRVLAGSSADRQGLRPGYVINQIDGVKVDELDDALLRLHGAAASEVRVGILDETDRQREVILQRELLGPGWLQHEKISTLTVYSLLESKRLDGGIGYLRFTSFSDALGGRLEAAFDSLRDAPGFVIDLRANSGGEDSFALKLAGHVIDKPAELMITRTRKGDQNNYRAKPSAHPYLGPLVILVDEMSASQTEQITAALQELGRAYVIGKKTAGEDLDADVMKLPTGAFFLYAVGQPRTPKGVVVEGRGVIPNLEVNLTRAELLKGSDAQLAAAIGYINQKIAKH